MDAFGSSKGNVQPKSYNVIMKAAIALGKRLKSQSKDSPAAIRPWMHHPHRPYAGQDLVHLCCLVDRGRPFTVDTKLSRMAMLTLQVRSYETNKGATLERNFSDTQSSKVPPVKRMYFRVFRSWLELYLEWFDPDLWDYIKVQTYGMTVLRLPG
jgi:hypothetical protein